jgi:hypothetical protein
LKRRARQQLLTAKHAKMSPRTTTAKVSEGGIIIRPCNQVVMASRISLVKLIHVSSKRSLYVGWCVVIETKHEFSCMEAEFGLELRIGMLLLSYE